MEEQNKIYTTRPEDKKSDVEERTYDVLEQLGIKFERVEHEEAATIEACKDVEKILGVEICKNLFLCNAQKTKFYLLMLPGDKVFKTKDISKQIGSSRLSFATPDLMEKYLGVSPGSVSVLTLINDNAKDVKIVIDKEVLKDEYIGCHPCKNTATLKIKADDIINKFLPYADHEPVYVEL